MDNYHNITITNDTRHERIYIDGRRVSNHPVLQETGPITIYTNGITSIVMYQKRDRPKSLIRRVCKRRKGIISILCN